jgi:hypothetical protein
MGVKMITHDSILEMISKIKPEHDELKKEIEHIEHSNKNLEKK